MMRAHPGVVAWPAASRRVRTTLQAFAAFPLTTRSCCCGVVRAHGVCSFASRLLARNLPCGPPLHDACPPPTTTVGGWAGGRAGGRRTPTHAIHAHARTHAHAHMHTHALAHTRTHAHTHARARRYMFSVSAGVAFMNALPVWAFDGAHVLGVLLVVAFPPSPRIVSCCRRHPPPKKHQHQGILDSGGGGGGGGGGGSSSKGALEEAWPRGKALDGGGGGGGAGFRVRRCQRWALHAGTAAMVANTVASLAVVLLRR
jgi:hypothetical protein